MPSISNNLDSVEPSGLYVFYNIRKVEFYEEPMSRIELETSSLPKKTPS
ncbi:hypothetical protein N8376_05170 [Flavobacteriaceae bacterium]|nr:hypothetical protein [Flavobacteriaceae bacterium]